MGAYLSYLLCVLHIPCHSVPIILTTKHWTYMINGTDYEDLHSVTVLIFLSISLRFKYSLHKKSSIYVTFDILMAVGIKIRVCWVVTSVSVYVPIFGRKLMPTLSAEALFKIKKADFCETFITINQRMQRHV